MISCRARAFGCSPWPGWLLSLAFVVTGCRLFIGKTDAFVEAARNGDLGRVIEYLDKGVDVNAPDSDGWMALADAALHGHGKVVQVLIDRGANVNAISARGTTPLILAAARSGNDDEQLRIVRTLITRGADPNLPERGGSTALMYAAGRGDVPMAEFLLSAKAKIEARDERGYTALMRAVRLGEAPMVKFLLDRGADVNARARDNTTALSIVEQKDYGKLLALPTGNMREKIKALLRKAGARS